MPAGYYHQCHYNDVISIAYVFNFLLSPCSNPFLSPPTSSRIHFYIILLHVHRPSSASSSIFSCFRSKEYPLLGGRYLAIRGRHGFQLVLNIDLFRVVLWPLLTFSSSQGDLTIIRAEVQSGEWQRRRGERGKEGVMWWICVASVIFPVVKYCSRLRVA